MFNRPWAFSTSTSESFSSLSATHSDIKGKSTIAKGLFECQHCCCGCYLWGLDSDWTECCILSHPTDTPSHTYHLPSSHHSSKHPLSLHGQTQPGLPHFILTVIQTTHNLSAGTHHLSPSSGSYFSTPNLHHLHPPLLPAYSSCFKFPFLSNATLFCSSRQNISIVSVVLFFSPPFYIWLMHPYFIQCNMGCKEHLYHSHPNRFARQLKHDVFPCRLQVQFSQQSQKWLKHGWYQIKAVKKKNLLNHINRRY